MTLSDPTTDTLPAGGHCRVNDVTTTMAASPMQCKCQCDGDVSECSRLPQRADNEADRNCHQECGNRLVLDRFVESAFDVSGDLLDLLLRFASDFLSAIRRGVERLLGFTLQLFDGS